MLVNVGCVTMAAGAGRAATVADVLAAQSMLVVPPGMAEAGWRGFRATHEAEMQAAYATLTLMRAVEEAVLTTGEAGFAQYGTLLLCNVDEERLPPFPALVERFVEEGARKHGMSVEAARPRLLQADITEMLPVALLSWYRCPLR